MSLHSAKLDDLIPAPAAVVLGGTVTALSVARSLTDSGIEVYVLDHRDSPVRRSRLCAKFVDVGSHENVGVQHPAHGETWISLSRFVSHGNIVEV